jgi:hypothetical protein
MIFRNEMKFDQKLSNLPIIKVYGIQNAKNVICSISKIKKLKLH